MRLEGRVSSEAEQNDNSYFKQTTVILLLDWETCSLDWLVYIREVRNPTLCVGDSSQGK